MTSLSQAGCFMATENPYSLDWTVEVIFCVGEPLKALRPGPRFAGAGSLIRSQGAVSSILTAGSIIFNNLRKGPSFREGL